MGCHTGKLDKETSPRILERLLEESQEASPSSSAVVGAAAGGRSKPLPKRTMSASSTLTGDISGDVLGYRRRPSGSTERSERSRGDLRSLAESSAPSAFLQSAGRELRHQLRHLGPQNSLDISASSTGVVGERLAGSGSSRASNSNQLQGLFRLRDESLHCDIDNSSTVNRWVDRKILN